MKKLILFISFIISFNFSFGQTPISYEGVVITNDTNQTKEVLYINAKQWCIDIFKDSKEVIQLDDKENGMIQGKGSIKYTNNSFSMNCSSGFIYFTFKIWVKKGRYKYEFSNFIHEGGFSSVNCNRSAWSYGLIYNDGQVKKGWNNLVEEFKTLINSQVSKMLLSLKSKMNETQDNDW